MPKHYDLSNTRFSRLVVLEPLTIDSHGSVLWLYRCDCGILGRATTNNLRSGKTTQCRFCADEALCAKALASIKLRRSVRLANQDSMLKSETLFKN